MTFINETLSQEEFEIIDFSQFKSAYVRNPGFGCLKKWTIDKETGTYLVSLKSSGPGGPRQFGFCFEGRGFQFGARSHFIMNKNEKADLVWRLNPKHILLPEEMETQLHNKEQVEAYRCKLAELISLALQTFGVLYNRDEFKSVQIKIEE